MASKMLDLGERNRRRRTIHTCDGCNVDSEPTTHDEQLPDGWVSVEATLWRPVRARDALCAGTAFGVNLCPKCAAPLLQAWKGRQ